VAFGGNALGITRFEQAVGSMGNLGDMRTEVTTATHKPACTSLKSGDSSSGKAILRNVILGRWSMKALESGSEAVEQVLTQPLKYMLIVCRGGLSMLCSAYACVDRYLQKCHISFFYG